MDSAVHAYYIKNWGAPDREAEFQVDGHRIELCKWNADRTDDEVFLYATIGSSNIELRDKRRVEFLLGLLPDEDNVAGVLATLASFPLNGGRPERGDTVDLQSQLWQGTEMTAFLIAPPRIEILQPLELADGSHVEFLPVIPVYSDELAFKRARGAEELMAEFGRRNVPWWSPRRRSLESY